MVAREKNPRPGVAAEPSRASRWARTASALLAVALAAQFAWLAAVPMPLPAGFSESLPRVPITLKPMGPRMEQPASVELNAAGARPGVTAANTGVSSARPTALLSLRVRERSGAPISRASIVASTAVSRQCATTDPKGVASLATPGDRPVALRVTAIGFEIHEATLTPPGAAADRVFETEVVLEPAPPLRGQLVDEMGQAIGGATVAIVPLSTLDDETLAQGLPSAVTTDGDGAFFLGSAPRRGVLIRAEKRGYARAESAPGEGEQMQLSMRTASLVRGLVRFDGGAPAAGVSLRVFDLDGPVGPEAVGRPVTSDAEGRVSVEAVPVGKRLVLRAILADGRSIDSPSFTLASGDPADAVVTIPR